MAVVNINTDIAAVRDAFAGNEVRDSIADGLLAMQNGINNSLTDEALDDHIKGCISTPLVAKAASDFKDTTKIYVFVGTTTSNYKQGYWYYYGGSSGWTEGGIYDSATDLEQVEINKTDITKLETDVSKNTSDISSLKTSNTTNTATIAALDRVVNRTLVLKAKAGAFDVTVSGFTNPKWTYNGQTISSSHAQFNIWADGGVVTFTWDTATNGGTVFTLASGGFAVADLQQKITGSVILGDTTKTLYPTGDLSDFGNAITASYYLQKTPITGDLACLDGKLTGTINIAYTNIHGIYTPTTASLTRLYCSGSKMTTSDVDATLNNIAAKAQAYSKSNGTIEGNSMSRTALSDNAITTLVGLGWTVSGFTKVVA